MYLQIRIDEPRWFSSDPPINYRHLEGCNQCHTAPLYTNNKLTRALGFGVPEDAHAKCDISLITVGTDPSLTMNTRRGTGYYKVPPSKVSGTAARPSKIGSTPKRLDDDYIPTGFKPYGTKTYPGIR